MSYPITLYIMILGYVSQDLSDEIPYPTQDHIYPLTSNCTIMMLCYLTDHRREGREQSEKSSKLTSQQVFEEFVSFSR